MASTEFAVKDLANAVNTQNGRVRKLEGADLNRQLAEAELRGQLSAKADSILGRRQVASVGLVAGASASVITVIAAAVALFA
jgi:hypothetical protein